MIGCILDVRGNTWRGFDMFAGSMVDRTVYACETGVRGDTICDSSLEMYCCVVWENLLDVYDGTFTSKKVEHSAGLDGDPNLLAFGPGNVIGDPRLWAIDFHDLYPQPGSPCIDAGDPAAPLDPDGSRDDIGACPRAPRTSTVRRPTARPRPLRAAACRPSRPAVRRARRRPVPS